MKITQKERQMILARRKHAKAVENLNSQVHFKIYRKDGRGTAGDGYGQLSNLIQSNGLEYQTTLGNEDKYISRSGEVFYIQSTEDWDAVAPRNSDGNYIVSKKNTFKITESERQMILARRKKAFGPDGPSGQPGPEELAENAKIRFIDEFGSGNQSAVQRFYDWVLAAAQRGDSILQLPNYPYGLWDAFARSQGHSSIEDIVYDAGGYYDSVVSKKATLTKEELRWVMARRKKMAGTVKIDWFKQNVDWAEMWTYWGYGYTANIILEDGKYNLRITNDGSGAVVLGGEGSYNTFDEASAAAEDWFDGF